MEDKKIRAFDFPKMRLTEKFDFELSKVLKSLEGAQLYFSIFQDEKGELKVVHSQITEELFSLVMAALHRNITVHEFYKLAMIGIEKFRDGDLKEATEFMYRASEYIQIKNNKKITL
jgi:hypothetical protein